MLTLRPLGAMPAHHPRQTPSIRFQASRTIVNHIHTPLSRKMGIAVYGGNKVSEHVLTEARRWGTAMGAEGFHAVTGGGGGVMEAFRQGMKEAGGKVIGSGMTIWKEEGNAHLYDRFTAHDTVTERMESKGGFYASAAMSLCFPGSFGTRGEVYRMIYDLLANNTSHPIQQRIVVADIDPDFTAWLKSQFNKNAYDSDQFLALVKTPEEAMAVFRDNRIGFTQGLNNIDTVS